MNAIRSYFTRKNVIYNSPKIKVDLYVLRRYSGIMASIKSNTEALEDNLIFIGNAIVFLEIDGVKIIVDPAFYHGSKSVNMGWGLRSRRLLPPAINIDDLPVPDILLLTHTHNDHWYAEAKAGLSRQIIVVTNVSAAKKLSKDGFSNDSGLNSEEFVEHKGLKIIAIPAQHGPRFMNPFTGSVIGFIIESSQGKLWVSGDTIKTKKLKLSLKNHQPTVGIVNFGGVRYILPRLTFTPSSAMKTMEDTAIETCFPVHVDDWTHFNTSKEDIQKEFNESKINLIFPPRGEKITFWSLQRK